MHPPADRQRDATRSPADKPAWACSVCQWAYDPALGDPEAGIAPGTAFEDVPDDWPCPQCGAGKEMYEPVAL